jgi:hypothetical protein
MAQKAQLYRYPIEGFLSRQIAQLWSEVRDPVPLFHTPFS